MLAGEDGGSPEKISGGGAGQWRLPKIGDEGERELGLCDPTIVLGSRAEGSPFEPSLGDSTLVSKSSLYAEFKNRNFIEFCGSKGIKREYSNARTPQQNGVAERKNRTLIEAAKTMLADSFLPNTFWAEVVSTACYVLNRPVRSENQAYKNAGPKEANHSAVKISEAKNEANDAAEALRKEFAQDTEDLLLQAGAARASSTNTINTASTPVSTANPSGGLSYTDLTNSDHDDSQIPALEDSYDNPNDGIFTNASYDDEGAVDDFTNLETIVTVSPISTSMEFNLASLTIILEIQNQQFKQGAKIEAIRIFLAFASYMGFIVYQMDVKRSFLYDTIDEEVYVSQPPGFVDPKCPKKVYKVVKALYSYTTAPSLVCYLSNFLLMSDTEEGTIDKTLFIKKDKNDIMLVQVYMDDIIFGSTKRSWCDEFEALMKSRFQMSSMGELTFFLGLQAINNASTPIETQKPLVKDEEATDVDVTLKTSHLNAVKRIFRYLKGKPKLGLWYPRVSSFDLDASQIGTMMKIVATSTTEAEYVAAANCCGQVLWIQNHMLDYGFNFMNTKIYIDNKSTICIVKKLVFHSKIKYIAISHYFIWDAYEKKLIHVPKIHTDDNVADLLTKAFNVSSYLGFRESLERDIDGTEELLLPDLFILWLTIVSTDSAKLIPLGKDSTAIETLEKIPPRV
ncbi:putative ribonuclease H-like domain-containing protein [Tanacetum coccineum]